MKVLAVAVVAILGLSTIVILNASSASSAPGAPTGLEATRGDSNVTLSWKVPASMGSSELTGYKIYRGTSADNLNVVISIGTQTKYVDLGLTNGVTYHYKISALNSVGEGGKSYPASATPSSDPITVPTAPRALTASPGQGFVTLGWQTPLDNGGSPVAYYEVQYIRDDTGASLNVTVGNVLEYDVEGLEEGDYTFKVRAVNEAGKGAQATVQATVLKKAVENLNIGYFLSSGGNHFGWQDMGTYLFHATVYHESLIGMDSEGNFVPRLADSWETDDSKTWTFHLTQNATWHDGTPFTASDVWFTINYTLEKRPWGMNDAKFMEQIQSVSMPDRYTIVIEMKAAYANLLNNMRIGMVVVPEHIYKFVNDPMTYGDPSTEMNATVGTGPYRVVSLDTTARVLKFTVNEDYYRGVPSVKNMTIRFYGNSDSMILALLNGEIDTTFGWGSGIDYYYVPQVLSNPDMEISLNPSVAIHALNFNCNKAPFNNVDLRKAVSYALNYAQLRDVIMGGYGSVANAGIVPPSMLNYIETVQLETNVNQAKQMLDSLGYVDIDGDGYRECPDHSEFRPQLLLSSSTRWVRSAEIIKANLNAVGIDVQLNVIASGFAGEKAKRQYDMVLSGTSQAGTFAWESYYTVQVDGYGSLGDCQMFDEDLQDIIDMLKGATTEEQKASAAQALQEYYAENIPALPLYWFQNIQPFNGKYQGYGYDIGFGTIMCYDTYFSLHRA